MKKTNKHRSHAMRAYWRSIQYARTRFKIDLSTARAAWRIRHDEGIAWKAAIKIGLPRQSWIDVDKRLYHDELLRALARQRFERRLEKSGLPDAKRLADYFPVLPFFIAGKFNFSEKSLAFARLEMDRLQQEVRERKAKRENTDNPPQ
jgi:hypothetical protein